MIRGATNTWRDEILARFTSDMAQACRLTLASDPNSDPVTGAELGAGPPAPQGRKPGKPDGA